MLDCGVVKCSFALFTSSPKNVDVDVHDDDDDDDDDDVQLVQGTATTTTGTTTSIFIWQKGSVTFGHRMRSLTLVKLRMKSTQKYIATSVDFLSLSHSILSLSLSMAFFYFVQFDSFLPLFIAALYIRVNCCDCDINQLI